MHRPLPTKKSDSIAVWALLVLVALSALPARAQNPLGTAFTYQGRLENPPGTAVDGACDFRIGLWDASAMGNQIGTSPQTKLAVAVENGIFTIGPPATTALDFGADAINGQARWLEIEVKCTGDAGYVLLTPRVEMTPAPHALALPGVFPDTATGNVGVGTTVPSETLDVAGIVRSSSGGFKFPDGTVLASAPTATPPVNLAQIGAQRWDLVNATFSVCDGPESPIFDGAHLWIACGSSALVQKISPSDASVVGSYPVGDTPIALVHDGANIWVANYLADTVSKLRAADGATLGTYPAGTRPNGLAFDGENIWVTNQTTNNIVLLRASDGANQGAINLANSPRNILFDGVHMWVTSFTGANVRRVRVSDHADLGAVAVSPAPRRMAFDGDHVWITTYGGTVAKFVASTAVLVGTFAAGSSPHGAVFDGANIWIAGDTDDSVTSIRATDGTMLQTIAVGDGPIGIAFDGASIWTANYSGDTITRTYVGNDAGFTPWTQSTYGITYPGFSATVGPGEESTSGFTVQRYFGLGVEPEFLGRHGRGTVAAPAPSLAGDVLVRFGGGGVDTAQFTTSRGYMEVVVPNHWSAGNTSTDMKFFTTAIGSTIPIERVRIASSGLIGMGRTPTTNRLEVEGNASKTTSGSWLANSDACIKEDVRTITDALSVIDRLRPVAFRYTNEYKSQHSSVEDQDYYNFIAQEFAEVFPEAVSEDGTGILQMDSHPASIYAVAAIQELHAIVKARDRELAEVREEKREELNSLKQENALLVDRLSRVERLLEQLAARPLNGAADAR